MPLFIYRRKLQVVCEKIVEIWPSNQFRTRIELLTRELFWLVLFILAPFNFRRLSIIHFSTEGDMKRYLINDNATKDEPDPIYKEERQDAIFEDFQGVSLLRTTCLECEQVTERKETFCDICVPIPTDRNSGKNDSRRNCSQIFKIFFLTLNWLLDEEETVDELYKSVIVTEELLMGCNKYWCEKCLVYNEAKRCVRYEKLPRLLTLHLKRFSSGFG